MQQAPTPLRGTPPSPPGHPIRGAGRITVVDLYEDFQRLLFVNRLCTKAVFFEAMRGGLGGGACKEVYQSHFSNTSHLPELCLSLCDTTDQLHIKRVQCSSTEKLSLYKTETPL